jgi:hypothetical protein
MEQATIKVVSAALIEQRVLKAQVQRLFTWLAFAANRLVTLNAYTDLQVPARELIAEADPTCHARCREGRGADEA